MREIVLDTETTGLDCNNDRIVEIGCIELVNHIPSGKTFHVYCNPQQPMSKGAFDVHGLSDEFLADKPLFAGVAKKFLKFIGDAPLVIHNAAFDMGFLNAELTRAGLPSICNDKAIDTLTLARRKHPNTKNTLDALCDRYGIDRSKRVRHGALLDAEILAEVYMELLGGRQASLDLILQSNINMQNIQRYENRPPYRPRITEDEIRRHKAYAATMGYTIWQGFYNLSSPSPTAEAAGSNSAK